MFVFILLVQTVNSYEILINPQINEGSNYGWKTHRLQAIHTIQQNGELESKFLINIGGIVNPYIDSGDIKLYLNPEEGESSPPIRDLSIAICSGWVGNIELNYESFILTCDKAYNFTIINNSFSRGFLNSNKDLQLENFSHYYFIFKPEINGSFTILINYITKNFIDKQGNNKVAWLKVSNMQHIESIENYIILPTENDFPAFLPNYDDIFVQYYGPSKSLKKRWGFMFRDTKDKIIFYQNELEIKDQEERLQWRYMWKGLIYGFVLSLLAIYLEQLFFNKIFRYKNTTWFKNQWTRCKNLKRICFSNKK